MPPTLADVSRLLAHGTSITLTTRDAEFAPEVTRCAAAAVRADGTVVVAVAVPEGNGCLANLDANRAVALTTCRPTTYEALQLKGVDARRAPWPDAAMAVDANRAGFVREVTEVGMVPAVGAAMWSPGWVTIAFTPIEIRDQTPGPR